MKLLLGALSIVLVGTLAAVFLFSAPRDLTIGPQPAAVAGTIGDAPSSTAGAAPAPATTPTVSSGATTGVVNNSHDIGPQPQLANPPSIAKGLYLTGWSAGSASKMKATIDLIKRTELNSVVVDIKDYSGYVSYATGIPEVRASGAENEIRIARPNALIKELHDNNIYVIGRITSFQDPVLAKAHPEWAMKSKTTGALWRDNQGLSWMDPAAKPVWDYLAAIAKDGFARGFDEIQFDYVRFASDGSIGNISYPYWDQQSSRASVIAEYFKFLRGEFPDRKISADLFGLATVNGDDLGIGQIIENAYKYFDYVSPMVYPSHYASGFLGYKSPGKYPYEVVKYSMDRALAKLLAMGSSGAAATTTAPISSKLRPWLQDFTINGVTYTSAMVRQQKQATYDSLVGTTTGQYYGGWLMWNASNNYTASALDPE